MTTVKYGGMAHEIVGLNTRNKNIELDLLKRMPR
ncbi:MAG: hypothetical protein JWM11_5851 [Planctomycetaceae bacterium]|nr:hypothetical protein [Planctomycetaceae bacterium]